MSAVGSTAASARLDRMVDELTSILLQQELLCKRLLELSDRDRLSVLKGQVADLESTIPEKRALVAEMERQEVARAGTARRLAGEMGLAGDASLLEIANQVEQAAGERLTGVRKRLVALAGKLKDSNQGNLTLMRKCLASVRDSLRQTRSPSFASEIYTSDGRPAIARAAVSSLALDRNA